MLNIRILIQKKVCYHKFITISIVSTCGLWTHLDSRVVRNANIWLFQYVYLIEFTFSLEDQKFLPDNYYGGYLRLTAKFFYGGIPFLPRFYSVQIYNSGEMKIREWNGTAYTRTRHTSCNIFCLFWKYILYYYVWL